MLGLCLHQGLHQGFARGQSYRLGCEDVRGVVLGLCLHQGLHEGFAPGGLTRLGCKDVKGVVWGFARGICIGVTRLGCKDVRELCWGCLCTRALHKGVSRGYVCTRVEYHKAGV